MSVPENNRIIDMHATSVLGSNSQVLLDPEHGENAKVCQHTLDDKDCKCVNNMMDISKCT
jgi:hypothetical protein